MAIGIDQRAAREPARDLPVRLEVAIERAPARGLDLGAEHADRPQGGSSGPAGAADGEREIADREPVELAERGRGEPAAGHAQDRDIGPRVTADDLGVALVDVAIDAGDAHRGAIGDMEAGGDHEIF